MARGDPLLTGNIDVSTLAGIVNGLLCSFDSDSEGLVSYDADTAWHTLCSVTAPVLAGQSVLLVGEGMLSHSDAGFETALGILEGASVLAYLERITMAGFVGGYQDSLTVFHILAPTVGNHTYTLSCNGSGGAGKTIYSASSRLYYLVFNTA